MKYTFAGLFLIFTLASSAQKKNKGYSSAAINLNIGNNTQSFGASFGANVELSKGAFFGLEAGVLKFQDLDGIYLPMLGKFTIAPNIDKNKLSPLLVLQPGYGIYQHTYSAGSVQITTRGGFDFYGGVGVVFPGKGKGHGFLTVGYSLFGFTTEDVKSNLEMVGIKTGIMFR
jgi:hypothetical protein